MSENSNNLNEERIAKIEEKLDAIVSLFISHAKHSQETRNIVDKNFNVLDAKIETIKQKISALHQDTSDGFGEVKDELVKIQKVSNYQEEYENLLKIAK